ncbi:related to thioredoxin [Saccharomycodes ludwigii]|uniref:Related to thioredoxin n=1 Tax=Saccharomycodes ludwigii TaxID=36035 RepID=A0A376B8P5_9ASCO|nr:hypothetical protein SCDLUD_003759 [Saccharomycodes ludwigii]KAH3900754.1 hypothetical protein SCDLUD_003759 [Saccharomycodes ludwigii]SSD60939.1 related to thioredoxin [Saccharomycodes ludwigii]
MLRTFLTKSSFRITTSTSFITHSRLPNYGRFNSTNSITSNIKKLNTLKEFQDSIKDPNKVSLIDFYATWCGPCKAISPVLEKYSAEFENVNFFKVDVDESPEVAGYCGITAMPTFIFCKDGKGIAQIVGANVRELKDNLEHFSKGGEEEKQ